MESPVSLRELLMSHSLSVFGALVAVVGIIAVVALNGGDPRDFVESLTPTIVAFLALLKSDQNQNVARKVEKQTNGDLDRRMRNAVVDVLKEREVKGSGQREL